MPLDRSLFRGVEISNSLAECTDLSPRRYRSTWHCLRRRAPYTHAQPDCCHPPPDTVLPPRLRHTKQNPPADTSRPSTRPFPGMLSWTNRATTSKPSSSPIPPDRPNRVPPCESLRYRRSSVPALLHPQSSQEIGCVP